MDRFTVFWIRLNKQCFVFYLFPFPESQMSFGESANNLIITAIEQRLFGRIYKLVKFFKLFRQRRQIQRLFEQIEQHLPDTFNHLLPLFKTVVCNMNQGTVGIIQRIEKVLFKRREDSAGRAAQLFEYSEQGVGGIGFFQTAVQRLYFMMNLL